MPNLLSKLNYVGTYICASIVGFGRKVEKKTYNKKKKRSARSTPYHTARVKSWKFVLEQDPSTLVKSPCTQKI